MKKWLVMAVVLCGLQHGTVIDKQLVNYDRPNPNAPGYPSNAGRGWRIRVQDSNNHKIVCATDQSTYDSLTIGQVF